MAGPDAKYLVREAVELLHVSCFQKLRQFLLVSELLKFYCDLQLFSLFLELSAGSVPDRVMPSRTLLRLPPLLQLRHLLPRDVLEVLEGWCLNRPPFLHHSLQDLVVIGEIPEHSLREYTFEHVRV